MKSEEVYAKLKKMIGLVSVGIRSTSSTKNPDGSTTITINFTSGSPLSFTMSPVKGDKGVGIKDALIKEIQNGENKEYHLILIDDKNNNIDAGKIPVSSGGSDSTWKGTLEEWESLSTEEKRKYEVVYFTDDYDDSRSSGSYSLWKGTKEEWEVLSLEEKGKYEVVCFTND